MKTYPAKKDDISIVLCGEAGQGIQTVEYLLTRFLKQCGYNFFATKEYMSRVRGGSNSTEIRVSSWRVNAFVERIDILIPLTKEALHHVRKRISAETIIVGERELLADQNSADEPNIIDVRFLQLAKESGGAIYSNTIAAGVISGLLKLELVVIEDYLRKFFSEKEKKIIDNNIKALEKGYKHGKNLIDSKSVTIEIKKDPGVKKGTFLNGAEAVGIGALSGDCTFISSYPMSPSTAVLVFLSQQSNEFDIIAEQAEDEISAINMAIGASYGGARSMVTTSGGGFDLMSEGISLAGMLEVPVVIHIAQRPGPATGLPTRTEQGDLELALYAGHGDFPRIIFAPGSVEDAFYLTRKAFNLADKYQVPVFILTDQYFIDSYYTMPCFDVPKLQNEKHIVKTSKNYKRYKLTKNGVSPRGIPGFGTGLAVVDSDEHDEGGHITENLDIRVKMVDKRMQKLDLIKREVVPPERVGNENSPVVVVCWGSTYTIAREAIKNLGSDAVSLLYFKQVYPLPTDIRKYFTGAKHLIMIENNATAQFSKLLKLGADVVIDTNILKYNGLQFSVEEITERLRDAI